MVDQKNQTLKDYKTALIFGVGGALIIAILVLALGIPIYNQLRKSSAELKAKESEQQQLEKKLSNLESLKAKEADLKTQNEKVLSALPEDKGVSRLFVQFENIAAQNGLDITSVAENAQTTTTATAGGLTPVTYVVTGTAKDYGSLKNALAKIETALRVLSVGKMDVTSSNNGLSVTLNVTTYARGSVK